MTETDFHIGQHVFALEPKSKEWYAAKVTAIAADQIQVQWDHDPQYNVETIDLPRDHVRADEPPIVEDDDEDSETDKTPEGLIGLDPNKPFYLVVDVSYQDGSIDPEGEGLAGYESVQEAVEFIQQYGDGDTKYYVFECKAVKVVSQTGIEDAS